MEHSARGGTDAHGLCQEARTERKNEGGFRPEPVDRNRPIYRKHDGDGEKKRANKNSVKVFDRAAVTQSQIKRSAPSRTRPSGGAKLHQSHCASMTVGK